MHAVFADCHVGREPGDEGPFLEALEKARRRGARAISLLGDVFQCFIALPKLETPAVRTFLDKVEELGRAGVTVTYVEGNRDFFVRGSYAERYFREVGREEIFEAGPRRFLLTHGDLLNARDYPYRFWRFLSKNRVSRAAVGILPRDLVNRIVWGVDTRLGRSNFKHKMHLPVEQIRAFARGRFQQGIDVLLLGHFHESWTEDVDGGRVEILPAFVDERRWMEVGDDGSTTLVSL